jgi:hypothetical protein
MTKEKEQTIQRTKKKNRQNNDKRKRNCLSFFFGHCIVCPFSLVIVLSVLFLWSLFCLSFFFGHCIVCPFSLVIVLSVLFLWSLYCLSFFFGTKEKGQTIQ